MNIGWGLPRQFLRRLGVENAPIIEIPKPVQNTTQLTTTKGEKKEAKIEGGENEAVKYNKNTYALATAYRQGAIDGKPRKKILPDHDGVIKGEYEYWLQPEDPTVTGMHIPRCTISVEDTWDAENGGQWLYTMDAVKEAGHDQVEWGTVTLTETAGAVTEIEFTEDTEPKDASE